MARNRLYRSGFSLIELLIVVAIIAALIGVAVPYFQSNLAEAQITKAKQDLDTIRNAINLYESRYQPIKGDKLEQILGQTMQEIPKDPWGGDYQLDASLGILWTYGGDGFPGGVEANADLVFKYKPALQVRKAEYEGAFGPPKENTTTQKGNKVILTFTKPYAGTPDLTGIVLRVSADTTSTTTNFGDTAALGVWTPDETKRADGVLILTCTVKPSAATPQTIGSGMFVDLNSAGAGLTVTASNSVLLGFDPAPNASADTTKEEKFYKGYPDTFFEKTAIPSENGLGARIERKL